MKKLLAVLIFTLSQVGFVYGFNEPENKEAVSFPGMEMNTGFVCTLPHPAMDLIQVIHDREMYEAYARGYMESGYCVQAQGLDFKLVRKWKTTNTSFDGYFSEMWEIKSKDGTQMWAIVWPRVISTRKGNSL